jgi:biotin transport system substrate-specific component
LEIAARIDSVKYNAFRWRYQLSIPKKLALSLAMVALTTLLAQIKFYLPASVVPVTGQTLGALFAGVLLGTWWGGISMLLYAFLGAIGLPLFAGWTHGLSVIAGPTGGYIVGFIFASLLLGYFTDRYVRARSFFVMLSLMLVANFVLIYIPGLWQLNNWLETVKGSHVAFAQLLTMGLIPFIPGDITKAIIGAAAARLITPKKAFGGEVDKDKWASWRIP